MAKDVLIRFLESMESVYGPFQMLSATDCKQWTPPPSSGGHRGRYLWTDAFGVINFLTLYRLNSDQNYLHLADSLIATVHQVLGSTRNGGSRLPGATAENPLGGGLRIGKEDEHGPDADGQYHHYLTIWMFALNRMSLATGDVKFNNQAISLAKAIHPRFLHNQISSQPRMYWKMTTDMSAPLVSGEGNTDPLNGYAVFRLLQQTSPDKTALQDEINDYKRILDRRVKHVVTQDSLDIGMTLWLTQWLEDEQTLAEQCIKQLDALFKGDTNLERSMKYRLAFRDFGMCMGMACCSAATRLETRKDEIVVMWERALPEPMSGDLQPITQVMHATALIPGGNKNHFYID